MRNSSPVAAGQTIANKYVVEGVLGEGGMGVVVCAWHLGLEQRVAIKLLLRERLQHDESAIERFQREARSAARIRSEHVCRVLDTGALDDGTPFLVMEYLDGRDLSAELGERGRLGASEAVGLIRQACEALAEAHTAGIIHRDLKPANLFLAQRSDGSRTLKVLDFGVSKSLSGSGTPHLTLTKTASLVGSPIYMSPEQLNSSKDVDGRTDIWALGSILYELITGRTPFYGETIPQLVNAVLHTEPPPFEELGIVAPAGLQEIVSRALSKRRDLRFANVTELSQALAPYAPDAQVAVSRTVKVATGHSSSGGDLTRSQPRASRHDTPGTTPAPGAPANGWSKGKWAVLILLLIAGAGVAASLSRKLAPTPSASDDGLGTLPVADHPDAGLHAAPVPEPAGSATEPAIAPPSPEPEAAQQAALPVGVDAPAPSAPAAPAPSNPAPLRPRVARPAPLHSVQPPAAAIPDKALNVDGVSNFGGRR